MRVSWQVAPVHAPPKPENVDPDAGVALNETVVPSEKPALQVAGQLIPAGLLVTDPLPEIDTISWGEEEPLAKAAETL